MIVVGITGWGRLNHHHRHYFWESYAVCNRAMRTGARASLENSDEPRFDDCKACRRVRDKALALPRGVAAVDGAGNPLDKR